MALRERSDTHVEVPQVTNQPHQFLGIGQATGVRNPFSIHIPSWIAPQGKDIGDATVHICAHHGTQLIDGVPDGRQVRNRQQGGVLGQLTGHPHRAITGGATRSIGHRDEHRLIPLENSCRSPQPRLGGLVTRRHELHRERDIARLNPGQSIGDRPRILQLGDRCVMVERVGCHPFRIGGITLGSLSETCKHPGPATAP